MELMLNLKRAKMKFRREKLKNSKRKLKFKRNLTKKNLGKLQNKIGNTYVGVDNGNNRSVKSNNNISMLDPSNLNEITGKVKNILEEFKRDLFIRLEDTQNMTHNNTS